MHLSRRHFLNGIAAASGVTLAGTGAAVAPFRPALAKSTWPAEAVWEQLRKQVGDRLIKVTSPLAVCRSSPQSAACTAMLEKLKNPFFIQDQPGGFQTNGWFNAWTAQISPYAVAAESPADIVAAVNFARDNNVKLAIKGAGHDYKGRNCAPESLLIWTHRMRDVSYDPEFRIAGPPASARGVPAVSAAAGARWIEAYQVATANGKYVQGGGCTSVGVAGGFIQNGGYGSFSKRYGTGAGSVLEFEVVTADGKVRIANEIQNTDLFWALRGGGGSTFGVVTRVTLMAHEMPDRFGVLSGRLQAANDDAFKDLLARLIRFYPGALNNPTWGEQIAVRPDNSVELFMTFLDLTEAEAAAVWKPLIDELSAQPKAFTTAMKFEAFLFEGLWNAKHWDQAKPDLITHDTRPEAPAGRFWWTTNQGEVGEFIFSYQSRWIPRDMFKPENNAKCVKMLFEASRHANVRLQINKGLDGASPAAIARDRKTSINPAVFDASTIIIIAERAPHSFPGVPGHQPDLSKARAVAGKIDKAMEIIETATPRSGSYGNESNFFEKDWKRQFYGRHYDRLLSIKKKYDPKNLFKVHHGVGSDV